MRVSEERGQGFDGAGPVPVGHAHHGSLLLQGAFKLHGQQTVPVREGGHAVATARDLVLPFLRTQAGRAVEASDGLEAVGAVVVLQLVQGVAEVADLLQAHLRHLVAGQLVRLGRPVVVVVAVVMSAVICIQTIQPRLLM